MTQESFTWGMEILENLGHLRVFQFMLKTYAKLGLTKTEFLLLMHLASYRYETRGSISRPARETIADEMGYKDARNVSTLISSLRKKKMLNVLYRQGSASVYDASPFATKALGLFLSENDFDAQTLDQLIKGTLDQTIKTPLIKRSTEEDEVEDESNKKTDSAADAAPSMTSEEAEAFLAESRIVGESSLDQMSDEEKAQVGSPASPPREDSPTATDNWIMSMHMAVPRYTYPDGWFIEDIIAICKRFSEQTGIRPPTDKAGARKWHAGARTMLDRFRDQLDVNGCGPKALRAQIAWCIDLFFSEHSPLGFIEVTSPHSLINSAARLGADMQAMQAANELSQQLPTPKMVEEFYASKGNGKANMQGSVERGRDVTNLTPEEQAEQQRKHEESMEFLRTQGRA